LPLKRMAFFGGGEGRGKNVKIETKGYNPREKGAMIINGRKYNRDR